MTLSLKVVTSDNAFQEAIMKQLIQGMNQVLSKIKGSGAIEGAITTALTDALLNSPEIQSLSSGELQQLFDIQSADLSKLSTLLNNVVFGANKLFSVSYAFFSRAGTNIAGGITVVFSVSNLEQISQTLGYPVWLEALTEKGDTEIILHFGVTASADRRGRVFYTFVPSQFSGTLDNNFLSRALERVSSTIDILLQTEFLKNASV